MPIRARFGLDRDPGRHRESRILFRALFLAFAFLVLGATPAHAQDDLILGGWEVAPLVGTPYAEKGHAFTVTATTFADVKAFRDSLTGEGKQQLDNRCLGLIEGGNPPAAKFYSAVYTWSGAGTVKGCLTPNGFREFYGTGRVAFTESRTTESGLDGGWHDAPGIGEWVFQATRGNDCGPARARTAGGQRGARDRGQSRRRNGTSRARPRTSGTTPARTPCCSRATRSPATPTARSRSSSRTTPRSW